MPSKKKNEEPLTQQFLAAQIDKVLAKIDANQRDSREQINSVSSGLNQRMEGLDQRMEGLDQRMEGLDQRMDKLEQEIQSTRKELKQDIHFTQLAVKGVKEDTVRIEEKLDTVIEKVERHDEEIVFLKAAAK